VAREARAFQLPDRVRSQNGPALYRYRIPKGLSMDPIKRPTKATIETSLSAYYGEADEQLYPEI